MSNTNGTNSFARSMNGIISYNDGAETVIQNGMITTEKLSINNILGEDPSTTCNIWKDNTGTTNYSDDATGIINIGSGSSGNVNLEPMAAAESAGSVNIGTSTNSLEILLSVVQQQIHKRNFKRK